MVKLKKIIFAATLICAILLGSTGGYLHQESQVVNSLVSLSITTQNDPSPFNN